MSAKKTPGRPQLIEGEDYYVERGAFVFSERYHLKRGYCCQSSPTGCRHCPYRGKPRAQSPARSSDPAK